MEIRIEKDLGIISILAYYMRRDLYHFINVDALVAGSCVDVLLTRAVTNDRDDDIIRWRLYAYNIKKL